VREKQVMPLERAVHKLTGEPAGVYGLAGRGRIAEGSVADICVFDPATIGPGPLRRVRDFPAGGERLTADAPTGVVHVLVGGVPIRLDGCQSPEGMQARPGELIRS
jgi:N-acyl-D-amino-acid deacylase